MDKQVIDKALRPLRGDELIRTVSDATLKRRDAATEIALAQVRATVTSLKFFIRHFDWRKEFGEDPVGNYDSPAGYKDELQGQLVNWMELNLKP